MTKPHTTVFERCSCQGHNNTQYPNPAWQPNLIPESLTDAAAKDKTIHNDPIQPDNLILYQSHWEMQLPRTKQYIVPQPSPTTKPHTRVIQWCGCRGGDSSGGEGGCHANRRGWGLHNVEDLHQRGLVADQCAQACQTRHTHIGVWRAQKCRWQSQPQWQKNGRVLLTKTMVTQYNSQHKIPPPPPPRKKETKTTQCFMHSSQYRYVRESVVFIWALWTPPHSQRKNSQALFHCAKCIKRWCWIFLHGSSLLWPTLTVLSAKTILAVPVSH